MVREESGGNVVTDIGSLHPEDYVFRDVGGVVGDAFEVARDEQCIESLAHGFRTLVHRLDQLKESNVPQEVDDTLSISRTACASSTFQPQ